MKCKENRGNHTLKKDMHDLHCCCPETCNVTKEEPLNEIAYKAASGKGRYYYPLAAHIDNYKGDYP